MVHSRTVCLAQRDASKTIARSENLECTPVISRVFELLISMSPYASNPPPTPHPTCPCAYSALWSCGAQHYSGAHPGAAASQYCGKPSGCVRRCGHGERVVRRLEAGISSHLIRAHGERLLLVFPGTDPGAISLNHAPPSPVPFPRRPTLLFPPPPQRCPQP